MLRLYELNNVCLFFKRIYQNNDIMHSIIFQFLNVVGQTSKVHVVVCEVQLALHAVDVAVLNVLSKREVCT